MAAFDPLPGYSPPAPLAAHYPLLGALPPDTPVPMDVLARLWRAGQPAEALEVRRAKGTGAGRAGDRKRKAGGS